ncbi:hypothetical protein ACQCT6_10055 [Cytobacillus gottheilii]|uniref:hypothetical protein n=1 Tax=Cytobacillus gottheilii TaxID=859144 RepID=UPI003CED2590
MKQYEYMVENIQIQLRNGTNFEDIITEKLNTLGREGWELAGVNGTVYYFKREI